MTQPLGIAMVGAGAFGEFCLKAFSAVETIRIAAIVDININRAQALANQYGAMALTDIEAMLTNADVHIVTLSTPPYLHHEQGLAALNAGKHLFCEKPLALTVEQGEEMILAAQTHHVHLTINYVMRHNPYWQAAAQLAQSSVLGALRHLDLANYAAGLSLADNHWFWDKNLSGGIWTEHGVHFFDAFSWVSGAAGHVIAAQQFQRSDHVVDRVEALLRYGDTAAHCYHSFDQSAQTEQTTVRLSFAKGYVTLREWVPTSLELLTTVERRSWERFLPGEITSSTLPNGQTLNIARTSDDKSALYTKSIQNGIRELAAVIHDPSRSLQVLPEYGLESLKTAVEAGGVEY